MDTCECLRETLIKYDTKQIEQIEADEKLDIAIGALRKILGRPPEAPALLSREIRDVAREALTLIDTGACELARWHDE